MSILFIGMVYYKHRKTEYVITRIDFPSGLTPSGKYDCIRNFIQIKRIKEVRGIYMCGNVGGKIDTLNSATFIYLDYVL